MNYVIYKNDKKETIKELTELIGRTVPAIKIPTIVCVGTDLLVGDSLAPLTGTLLKERGFPGKVLGTLEAPVHSTNLEDILVANKNFKKKLVIAIGASLDEHECFNRIYFQNKQLHPRTGLREYHLPKLGNYRLTGAVGSLNEGYVGLKKVRLRLVYDMAKIISEALLNVYGKGN